jgi:hypothetical protein
MRPRPLALRREVEVKEEYQCEFAIFHLAFRHADDAYNAILDNNGRHLPDLEDLPWIDASLICDPSIEASLPEGAPPPPATELIHLRAKKEKEELAVEWKWGEMSTETQRSWRIRQSLPTSRRCAPRAVDEEKTGSIIGSKYRVELVAITHEAAGNVEAAARTRRVRELFAEEKKKVYEERSRLYREWCELPDREAAIANGEKPPDWPTYPLDEVVKEKVAKRRQAEKDAAAAAKRAESEKAQEELRERLRLLQEASAAASANLVAILRGTASSKCVSPSAFSTPSFLFELTCFSICP